MCGIQSNAHDAFRPMMVYTTWGHVYCISCLWMQYRFENIPVQPRF
jgi:hypothetical protein